jgi:hypothetical protein
VRSVSHIYHTVHTPTKLSLHRLRALTVLQFKIITDLLLQLDASAFFLFTGATGTAVDALNLRRYATITMSLSLILSSSSSTAAKECGAIYSEFPGTSPRNFSRNSC